VVQFDLNSGLGLFADGGFEVVVLSQTLQAVRDVERVISEMLRVGHRGIVSFPNFGYHKIRRMLADLGRAPESAGLLRFHWYDTPNLRFFTIADFEEFCRARGIAVHQCIGLDTEEDAVVTDDPNLRADMAIFVISRQ
jgi:methionine biosynthesis protein MetW